MASWYCWSPGIASDVLLIVTLLLFYVFADTGFLAFAGTLLLRATLMMFCINLQLLDSGVLTADGGNLAASVFAAVASKFTLN